MSSVFTDIKVIGECEDPELIIAKLQNMQDPEFQDDASEDENPTRGSKGILELLNLVQDQPWMCATHKFGYISPTKPGSLEPQAIKNASAITADTSLKNNSINIRLDRLHIAKYPGGGTHNVMVTFKARNQVADTQETVSFSQTYRVQEGQSAGIAGYPVFIGLNVGSQGVAFECSTVNVKNTEDQAILSALESSPFQNGLKLLTTAQPAIAPFTEITLGVVKMLAERHENVAVQKFSLGLDFENMAMGCSLAEGNYIAIQVPDENVIDWVMSYKILTYITSTTIERIFIVEYDSIYNAQSAYTGIDSTFTTRAYKPSVGCISTMKESALNYINRNEIISSARD